MKQARQWVKRNKPLRTLIFALEVGINALRSRCFIEPDNNSRKFYISAMIRVKNEARFMPEWIAHYLQLGIEHVFIYDNNSTDGLEQVLRPFLDRSLVTVVKWPPIPAAPSCHNHFLRNFGGCSQWVCFFDADEFLVERRPGELLRTLRAAEDYPAVAINWRYFGSSWHERIPDGLVTEHFTLADEFLNSHVKIIAQPKSISRWRNDHNFYYIRGKLARTADWRRVLGSFADPVSDPPLVLNHYVYRSREDFDRKARRGYSTARGALYNIRNAERSAREFHRHNQVPVPMPSQVVTTTKGILRSYGYGEPFLEEKSGDSARRG